MFRVPSLIICSHAQDILTFPHFQFTEFVFTRQNICVESRWLGGLQDNCMYFPRPVCFPLFAACGFSFSTDKDDTTEKKPSAGAQCRCGWYCWGVSALPTCKQSRSVHREFLHARRFRGRYEPGITASVINYKFPIKINSTVICLWRQCALVIQISALMYAVQSLGMYLIS